MKKKEFSKPCSNLIMMDMYTYNPSIVQGVVGKKSDDTYLELQVVEDNNGIHEEYVEVDYPITPEYVKSFESSANYKNDIDSALNAPKRANLGDITKYQELLEMDTALIADMAKRLELANKALAEKQTVSNVNTEVKSNE